MGQETITYPTNIIIGTILAALSGLLPICAWCKKVRDDDGYWQQLEDYFSSRSHIQFTHGMCADGFRVQTTRKS